MWFIHLMIIIFLLGLSPVLGIIYIIGIIIYYSKRTKKPAKTPPIKYSPEFRTRPPVNQVSNSVIYVQPTNSSQIIRPNPYGNGQDFFYARDVGKRLNIDGKDKDFIKRLWGNKTSFLNITQCEDETVKLYLTVLHALGEYRSTRNCPEPARNFLHKLFTEKTPTYFDSNFYNLDTQGFVNSLFKLCENKMRKNYRFGRKLDHDHYTHNLLNFIDSLTLEFIENQLEKYKPDISFEKTRVSLSLLTPSAWKEEFKQIKKRLLSEGYSQSIEKEITALIESNDMNQQFSELCFELFKLLSQYHAGFSLTCYLLYKANRTDNGLTVEDIPPTVKKTIFGIDEKKYKEFISMPADTSLEEMQKGIIEIFKTKRKKIVINSEIVEQKRQLDNQVAAEISEVLTDADQLVMTDRINSLEEVFNNQKNEDNKIDFSELQKELLQQFIATNYTISRQSLDEFSKRNNHFASTLINEINEVFYEKYEDILISEEENIYIICEPYRATLSTI